MYEKAECSLQDIHNVPEIVVGYKVVVCSTTGNDKLRELICNTMVSQGQGRKGMQ